MMTFTVYAELAPEVSKKLDRLAKKASTYGVPFSYSAGEEHPQQVAVRVPDPVTQTIQTVSTHTVAAVDFEVECDELIRASGWTVRARVEHGDKGNIVTPFGGYKAKPEWYTVAANCDHCQTNRYRGVTFFVEHEDGSMRQVGRTCLKDYTGISPATVAMWAEIQDLVDRGMDCTPEEWGDRCSTPMYEVLRVLAHAADAVCEYGYRKSAEPNSTRDMVTERVLAHKEPTEAGLAEASEVAEWLTGLEQIVRDEDAAIKAAWEKFEETDEDEDNRAYWKLLNARTGDIERNCIPLVLSGFAKARHFGLLAYMPMAYKRHQERLAREKERQAQLEAAAARSKHVGEIGQRITLKAATVALLTSWEGYYGTTWLYKFVDDSGNVFIWKASQPFHAEDGAVIRATVKDHDERDGVKQTIVTRCCLAA